LAELLLLLHIGNISPVKSIIHVATLLSEILLFAFPFERAVAGQRNSHSGSFYCGLIEGAGLAKAAHNKKYGVREECS
jgi:hypothetical protein